MVSSNRKNVQLLPTYDAFVENCLNVKDNYLFSNKRESIFKELFNDNNNNITDGIMFMYENKWHTQNIFHQLNWYLSHFHDIISSKPLLNILKYYYNHNSFLNSFNIIIIFPRYNIKSYHWSCELLKAYPFKLRWGENIFKSINVECYFYNDTLFD